MMLADDRAGCFAVGVLLIFFVVLEVVQFYSDVEDLFKKGFLPAIMGRIADKSKETWDRVVGVLDEADSRIRQFVNGAWTCKTQD